ncbi:MAG: ATP-binding cassette domain-containing protein [Propionibacteriaceae bacterium]|jgi:ABC-type lipoprotein export system ATPase subunit|nr:ATP-binding cassette domain-containing protein [Propionibacteriaceae bacterium]
MTGQVGGFNPAGQPPPRLRAAWTGRLPTAAGEPGDWDYGQSALTLAAVSHSYVAGEPLFEPVSAQLRPGSLHAVTGASGSGKSTLLGILAGWIKPTSGTLRRPPGMTVSWVFQNPHGVARRTALDHVAFPFLAVGWRRSEAAGQALALLEQFGLTAAADRSYRDLSGGERLRLMLARAIASRPDLLLVDEPTAQLDALATAAVNKVIATMATAGVITVVATHDPQTAAVCDEIVVLRPPLAAAARPAEQP